MRRPPRLGIAVSVLLSAALGGAAAVADSLTDFHRVATWTQPEPQIGTHGFSLVDLDGDSTLELVTSSRVEYLHPTYVEDYWYVLAPSEEFEERFSSTTYSGDLRALSAVRLSESASYVLVASSVEIQIFDGRSLSLLRTLPAPSGALGAVTAAELSGSGGAYIAACDDTQIFVLDFQTGAPLLSVPFLDCDALSSGQVDSDAALEIAVTSATSGAVIVDGVTLLTQWSDPTARGYSIALADLDGDGLDEVVYPSSNPDGVRAVEPQSGSVIWEHAPANDFVVAAGDLRGDSRPEVAISTYLYSPISVLDGSSGAVIGTVSGWTEGAQALAIGDVTGNGPLELVVAAGVFASSADALLRVAGGSLLIFPRAEFLHGPYLGLSAMDVDLDGRLEIATASPSSTGSAGWGGRYFTVDLASQRLDYLGPQFAFDAELSDSVCAQIDADPQPEQCVLVGANTTAPWIHCEDGLTRATEWTVGFPEQAAPAALEIADLEGDGQVEVLVGTDLPAVFVFEGASGWLRYRTELFPNYPSPFSVVRVGDVDDDGSLEIVAGGEQGSSRAIAIFDAATGSLKYGPWYSLVRALDVAQLESGGALEILVGTRDGEIALLDPLTGALSSPIATYPGPIEAIRIADVSRDGVADLVFTTGGRIRVLGGAEASEIWASPILGRLIGSRDSLFVTDYDLDTVPELLANLAYGFVVYEAPLVGIFADGFESGDTSAWSTAVP